MQEGFSFQWPAGGNPVMISPNGTKHELLVDNYVPYLPEFPLGGSPPCDAAPSAAEAPVPEAPLEEAAPPGPPAEDAGNGEGEQELPLLPPPGRDLKAEATSEAHLMTHMPKTPALPRVQHGQDADQAGASAGLARRGEAQSVRRTGHRGSLHPHGRQRDKRRR